MTVDLDAKLEAVLAPVLGAGTTIENLRALTGGASRTTWAFDAVTGSQRRALILRTGPPDDVHAGMGSKPARRPRPRLPARRFPHLARR